MKNLIHGARVGVLIGLVCSIIMSYTFSSGVYYPMSPYSTAGKYFYDIFSEPTIFIIALFSWAFIGIGFMLASKIFQHETWSTLKMTITHFFSVIGFFFPLSVLSGWYPLNMRAFLLFVAIFIMIYMLIWIIMFFINQRRVKMINEQLNRS